MKIALLALCVVLPSICLCAPLPQYGGSATAESAAKAETDGTGTAKAKADAHATADGPGGRATASASASASVGASGNKCGKPDVQEFGQYSVLVKGQGDVQKFQSVSWMLWKSSYTTSTTSQCQESVCAPTHWDQPCQASQIKITVQSETDIFYEVYGFDGRNVVYIKQKLSMASQQYQIYTSQVVSVAMASTTTQEVVAIQDEQVVKQYFDSESFAILDTDYETYMICTTSGENSITFVSLSQEVYENVDLKQKVSQKVEQVLQVNNLSSVQFVEVTNKFSVDITQYQWDQVSQSGPSNGNQAPGSGAQAKANADASASGGKGNAHAKADASAKTDGQNSANETDKTNKPGAHAAADASANADGYGGGKADAHAAADASANANGGDYGKPTEQGFTNYSVLKISSDEFQSKIDKKTWFVAKYTQSQEQVTSDVTVCADRYICSSCKAVKFQYVSEEGSLVVKEWGCDDSNLIYIQEKVTFSSQQYAIMKAEVVNVMKATVDTTVAVSVENKDQVTSYLSSEYAVLGTDFENFFIGQTSSDKGSITFIAYTEEVYNCETTQQQFSQQITQILKANSIEESSLQTLTQKFIADTNKYNSGKGTSNQGGAGAHASADASADAHGPGANAHASTDAHASADNGGNPPCDNSPPPPPCDDMPPPPQPPPPPPPPCDNPPPPPPCNDMPPPPQPPPPPPPSPPPCDNPPPPPPCDDMPPPPQPPPPPPPPCDNPPPPQPQPPPPPPPPPCDNPPPPPPCDNPPPPQPQPPPPPPPPPCDNPPPPPPCDMPPPPEPCDNSPPQGGGGGGGGY